jgi:cytochrome b6-f complex iron-sulfur subunit
MSMPKEARKKEAELATSRRSFLAKIWLGLGIVAVAECAWVIISFLRPREHRIEDGEPGAVVEAGPAESFDPGTVTAFPRGDFYLARLENGGFLALSCKCTHLGCTVPWVQAKDSFVCPCHSSSFGIAGHVLSGPAPRALDLYPIVIENNIVRVDTRKSIKRTGSREDQIVYPKQI